MQKIWDGWLICVVDEPKRNRAGIGESSEGELTSAPSIFASWMAAIPTPPAAE